MGYPNPGLGTMTFGGKGATWSPIGKSESLTGEALKKPGLPAPRKKAYYSRHHFPLGRARAFP